MWHDWLKKIEKNETCTKADTWLDWSVFKRVFAKFGVIFAFMEFYVFYFYVFFFPFFVKPLQLWSPYALFRIFKSIFDSSDLSEKCWNSRCRLCEMLNDTFTNYERETRKETFLIWHSYSSAISTLFDISKHFWILYESV